MAHFKSILGSREQEPCDLIRDRISNLPCNVLDIILSNLPILEAVRTSILSREWRYKWLSLSQFVLDYEVISLEDDTCDQSQRIAATIVNRYLVHHTGPITKFSLRIDYGTNFWEPYQWIHYLSKQDVKLLSLKNNGEFYFRVPSSLFSFKKSIGLLLKNCDLRVPSDFGGFNSLRELILRHVTIDCSDLNRLILSCPILEKLTLLDVTELTLLRIFAPRLTSLVVDTKVDDIVIEAAPCLASVIVVDAFRYSEELVDYNSHGIIENFFGLDSIKHLAIPRDIIKLLAVDYGVGNFPWRNSSLTSLTFDDIRFETIEEFSVCLSLLSSCYNVAHFFFTVKSAKGQNLIANFLKTIQGHISFPELISIEMIIPEYVGMGCAVNFLQFICAHSPNLKLITVIKKGGNDMKNTRVFNLLDRLRKLRPEAIVEFAHNVQHTKRVGKNLSVI